MVLDVARTLDLVGLERAALEFMKHCPVRLAHHLGQHIEPAAVGHAKDDLLEPHIAAALDDLLQSRDQRFTAIQAESLGALVLDVDELLETFRLDQLLQDRLLAHVGEFDALVRTLDALLDPGFFFRIGNVHELDTERRAIGALEDVEHLGDGGIFEPEHVIDEDLAVVIGFGEAIGLRRKLIVIIVRLLGDSERIELGVQMSAHAVGPDHHDGADRIPRCLQHIAGIGSLSGGFRLLLELVADNLFDRAPIAVQR